MNKQPTHQFWWQSEENTVRLWMALERAKPEQTPAILCRVGTVLADPEHDGLRAAFGQWACQAWFKDGGLLAGGDEALRGKLDRLAEAGDLQAMASLADKEWELVWIMSNLRYLARARERNRLRGIEQVLARQTTRRFGADTAVRLSALLAGVSAPERLAVGDAVIKCGTGEELLAAARRIVGDRTE